MKRVAPPRVRPRQRVTIALFEQMERAIRAVRLIAGKGVRLRPTPDGTVISFDKQSALSHAWLVTLQGTNSAQIEPGTINGVPATIDGKPLDGGRDSLPPPLLKWSRTKVDSEGRGYIAAECTFDPAKAWGVTKVEIVQVADCDTDDGAPNPNLPNATGAALPLSDNRARWPLAMLRQRKNGTLDVIQICAWPLTTRAAMKADGKTPSRHFFYS